MRSQEKRLLVLSARRNGYWKLELTDRRREKSADAWCMGGKGRRKAGSCDERVDPARGHQSVTRPASNLR